LNLDIALKTPMKNKPGILEPPAESTDSIDRDEYEDDDFIDATREKSKSNSRQPASKPSKPILLSKQGSANISTLAPKSTKSPVNNSSNHNELS